VIYLAKFSITLNSFLKLEPLEQISKIIAEVGLRYIEIPGAPNNFFLKTNKEIFNTYNLSVLGVTGLWTNSKEMSPILLTKDPQIISFTKKYIQECIKMCNYFGGTIFNLCLLSDYSINIDSNHELIPNKDKRKLLQRLLPNISEITNFSKDYGVYLLIEPLNRYSTPFCSNAEDALFVSSNINDDHFAILLDTYHMNIEEKDFSYSIKKSKTFLKHLHFSDSNRKMPGFGHINFNSIFRTLKKIQYSNYIGLEPLVGKNYKKELKKGLNFLNEVSAKHRI
jgi:D-psicose/D-tagatose/L-ribulose 3-epimerase